MFFWGDGIKFYTPEKQLYWILIFSLDISFEVIVAAVLKNARKVGITFFSVSRMFSSFLKRTQQFDQFSLNLSTKKLL